MILPEFSIKNLIQIDFEFKIIAALYYQLIIEERNVFYESKYQNEIK